MELQLYEVYQIQFDAENLEQLGTKEKFWFRGMPSDELKLYLFKFARPDTGEHWAEKIAEQLALVMGIPHVSYDLAQCAGRYGVVTPNVAAKNCRMVMGNEVLHQRTQEYPTPEARPEQYVRVKEHTITRVLGCLDLSGVHPPEEIIFEEYKLTAADIFCGYLLLDTLISNQDRHHENWAIIVNNSTGDEVLCPSYDHGASLGRELTDRNRQERLNTRDEGRKISTFVRKSRSEFFKLKTDKKPLLNIDCFFMAVNRRPVAKKYWLQKLSDISPGTIENILKEIPVDIMSEVSKKFTLQLLLENRKRLLEDERV